MSSSRALSTTEPFVRRETENLGNRLLFDMQIAAMTHSVCELARDLTVQRLLEDTVTGLP